MKKKFFSIVLLIALALSACNMPTVPTDTTAPVLQNEGVSDQNLFYSERDCGPTSFSISVDASDDSGALESVGVQYRYRGGSSIGASLAWHDVSMTTEGQGHFWITLDTAEADATLRQGSGVLEYQVYAVDMAGNITTSPEKNARSISVQHCSSGVASEPLTSSDEASAPPAPENTGSVSVQPTATSDAGGFGGGSDDGNDSVASQPTSTSVPTTVGGSGSGSNPTPAPTDDTSTFIGNADEFLEITLLTPSSNTIYYGQCSNNEPTSITFYAQITHHEKYGNGQGIFAYYDPATDTLGGDIGGDLDNNGGGNFSFWTGDNLNTGLQNFFQGRSGNLIFRINAVSTEGLKSTSVGSLYIDVLPCDESAPTPPPVINVPTVDYFYGPSGAVESNSTYTVEWSTMDANCGVYIDNEQVDMGGTQTMTAPFSVGTGTVTHTLIAYSEPCYSPTHETVSSITVTVEDTSTTPTIMSGSAELYLDESVDLDYSGSVDLTFVRSGDEVYFYTLNNAYVSRSIDGTPPNIERCRSIVGVDPRSSVGFFASDYYCYQTGSGNYGVLEISYVVNDLNNSSNTRVFFTYQTEVFP